VFGGAGLLISLYLTVLKIGFGVPLYNRPLLFLGTLLHHHRPAILLHRLIGELVVNLGRSKANKRDVSIRSAKNISLPQDDHSARVR
jgi:hypothetical protein